MSRQRRQPRRLAYLLHDTAWPVGETEVRALERLAVRDGLRRDAFNDDVDLAVLANRGAIEIKGERVFLAETTGVNTIACARCCSLNHPHNGRCWGDVRACPLCATVVCCDDGAADDLDDLFPGICDTCAHGIRLSNPEDM